MLEGDLDTARDLSTRSAACASQLPLRGPRASRSARRGSGSRTEEREGAAEQAPGRGHFTAIGQRLEAARAKYLEGLARAGRASGPEALELLTEAESVFAECRAARLRAEARGELRRFGRRVATAQAARLAVPTDDRRISSLSARERQVALTGRGRKTNRQIASDLVVSEKTVESHLGHIFVKLDGRRGRPSPRRWCRAARRGGSPSRPALTRKQRPSPSVGGFPDVRRVPLRVSGPVIPRMAWPGLDPLPRSAPGQGPSHHNQETMKRNLQPPPP